MASSIMIISNSSTFITDSLKNHFEKSGFYPVSVMGTKDKRFPQQVKDADFCVIYASDEVIYDQRGLGIVREACQEDIRKGIFLVGYEEEIDKLGAILIPESIVAAFERPFDMKELTTAILEHEDYMIKNQQTAEGQKKRRNILLCDDDLTFLKMMQGWLSEYYDVNIVKSGAQAIAFISKKKPDLILLDYAMPVVSGAQVIEMIRSEKESQDIPVIFLTGKSDRKSVVKVLKFKPQGYMLKTLSRGEILTQLQEFFESHYSATCHP